MQQGSGVSGAVPPARSVGTGDKRPSWRKQRSQPSFCTSTAQQGAGSLFPICTGILIKTTAGFVHVKFAQKFLVSMLKALTKTDQLHPRATVRGS